MRIVAVYQNCAKTGGKSQCKEPEFQNTRLTQVLQATANQINAAHSSRRVEHKVTPPMPKIRGLWLQVEPAYAG